MSKPVKDKSAQSYISISLMVFTILATLVTAVPGFLSLKKDVSRVVYEVRNSEMLMVKGIDKRKIKKLLTEQNLPDAITTLRLQNIGDSKAKDVRVSVVVPGNIVAVESIPSKEDKPAWVDFTKEYNERDDNSRLIYKLLNLGVGPTFQIDLSYRKEGLGAPSWSVFSDGVSAENVSSIEAIIDNEYSPLRKSMLVFLAGLLITILVTITLKARTNQQFANIIKDIIASSFPILFLRVKTSYRENWYKYKINVIENLVVSGFKLLALGTGNYHSHQTIKFWDAVLELNGIKIGLDVHIVEQKWSGVIGSEHERSEFLMKIISMSRSGALKPIVVFDENPWLDGQIEDCSEMIKKLSSSEVAHEPIVVIGNPEEVASQIISALSDKAAVVKENH